MIANSKILYGESVKKKYQGDLMSWAKLISGAAFVMVAGLAFAQDKCVSFNTEDTKIVDRGDLGT